MKKKSVINRRNTAWVVVSNLLALLTAAVIGLVMPGFVSYETYAGYRTYTLYISYAGLFHLGMVNGIALRFGGVDYAELPFERFRLYTRSLMVQELAFGAFLLFICGIRSLVSGIPFTLTPVVFVIINLFAANMRHYFSTVDRFSGRFTTDAGLSVLYDAAMLAGFFLLCQRTDSARAFLTFITLLNICLIALYLFRNREICLGPLTRTGRESVRDVLENIRRGGYVMLGEIIGGLFLGIDSICVQLFFDAKQFSEYTFAVYVLIAAYTVMSAANTLIFPWLKRMDKGSLAGLYTVFKRAVLAVSAGMLVLILLCRPLITYLLPGYEGSLPILTILSGTLVFRALSGIACGNFMLALDMERPYFRNNVLALLLALVSDTLVMRMTGDMRHIAAASLAVYVIWFFMNDRAVRRRLRVGMFNE